MVHERENAEHLVTSEAGTANSSRTPEITSIFKVVSTALSVIILCHVLLISIHPLSCVQCLVCPLITTSVTPLISSTP